MPVKNSIHGLFKKLTNQAVTTRATVTPRRGSSQRLNRRKERQARNQPRINPRFLFSLRNPDRVTM